MTFFKNNYFILKYFFSRYKIQTFFVIIANCLSSISESISIISLLPLLELLLNTNSNSPVYKIFLFFNIVPNIGNILFIIVAGVILKSIFSFFSFFFVGYVVSDTIMKKRIGLINSILNVNWKFFLSQPSGKLSNALLNEADKYGVTYAQICVFIAAILQIIFLIITSLVISVKITFLAILIAILLVILLSKLVSLKKRAGTETAKSTKSLSSKIIDILGIVKTLKAMSKEDNIQPMLNNDAHKLKIASIKSIIARQGLIAFREPPVVIIIAFIIYYAMNYMQIMIPSLLILIFLFHRIVISIGQLQSSYSAYVFNVGFFWSYLETEENLTFNQENIFENNNKQIVNDDIFFNNVSFLYDKEIILSDVNFNIKKNKLTMLIGSSGAGKTTIVDLLCRLHVPNSGNIIIGKEMIHNFNIKLWRKRIGYVGQDNILFNDTIANNISLYNNKITKEDILLSLKKADILDFVETLPNKSDSYVGERGLKLSGGQKQRICIARALVNKPELLILDEATSNLDPNTSENILKSLSLLKDTLTILAISHQNEFYTFADYIYNLKDGKVDKIDVK